MVATTKGPANAPAKRASKPAAQQDPGDLQQALGFTDDEWGRVQMHANGSSSTPLELIRRTVFLAVGKPSRRPEDVPGHG